MILWGSNKIHYETSLEIMLRKWNAHLLESDYKAFANTLPQEWPSQMSIAAVGRPQKFINVGQRDQAYFSITQSDRAFQITIRICYTYMSLMLFKRVICMLLVPFQLSLIRFWGYFGIRQTEVRFNSYCEWIHFLQFSVVNFHFIFLLLFIILMFFLNPCQ